MRCSRRPSAGRSTPFAIPMRGNEEPKGNMVQITGRKFAIPMRGNELCFRADKKTAMIKFAIPMRGNEQFVKNRIRDLQHVCNPHEG